MGVLKHLVFVSGDWKHLFDGLVAKLDLKATWKYQNTFMHPIDQVKILTHLSAKLLLHSWNIGNEKKHDD